MRCRFQKFAVVSFALAITGAAAAGDLVRAGDIEIDTPWVRASIGTARPAVASVTIRNTGNERDRLLSVTSPLAGHAMLHESEDEGGVMKMKALEDVDIPPQREIALQPGGTHFMPMDLQEALVEGGRMPLTLIFERAGSVDVDAAIGSISAREAPE